ncbi:MAG TPA: ABC transporter ATP-binding protein [Dehalococcoidia bacterium]|nr:ABC transporter ATP-binding protein [Dehalococcoidia bacterium]
MGDIAIRAEALSKQYRIGTVRHRHDMLREVLADGIARLFSRDGQQRNRGDLIWAIRNVSFEVRHGEVKGIIGRNGAGKSTLLKILSRITEPTSGRAEIYGRVGSLLEVGTGFHPELTGRENIYLSGAILGMKKAEIARKFDAIVAFAEVEKFLDTPVKRYSSGMYVRLAFAVAAHLDPEILIVDEVLAVGDAVFQKRCLDHMAAMARSGRTVLFVSHNMDLIPRLCRTALLLRDGAVALEGPAPTVVAAYLAEQGTNGAGDLRRRRRSGDSRARFVRAQLVDQFGQPRRAHPSGEDLVLRMEVESTESIPDADLAVLIKTPSGARLVTGWTREAGFRASLRPGTQTFQCRFHGLRLRPGRSICIGLWMGSNGPLDSVEEALVIDVVDGPDSARFSTDRQQGAVLCDYTWAQL